MTLPKINSISVHELKRRWSVDPDLCLIDVREDHEWQEQHIPGALHIPKDELATAIETMVPQHDHPIYLHCRGGTRSLVAAQCLLDLGYRDIYSIDGGISEWASAGYPIEGNRQL